MLNKIYKNSFVLHTQSVVKNLKKGVKKFSIINIKGISLMVLIITITSRYDKGQKASKIASFLPNKITENIKIYKNSRFINKSAIYFN